MPEAAAPAPQPRPIERRRVADAAQFETEGVAAHRPVVLVTLDPALAQQFRQFLAGQLGPA